MIALGDHVHALEVAYNVRKGTNWYVPTKGNYSTTEIWSDGKKIRQQGGLSLEKKGRWLHDIQEDTNKAVVAFPCVRDGIVIGLEVKHYGHSSPSSGGYNSYNMEYDYDQGFLIYQGRVELYVVKTQLRSTPFYVPESALSILELTNE